MWKMVRRGPLAWSVACAVSGIVLAAGCGDFWDDPIYYADRSVEKRWLVGDSPVVIVRLPRGLHVHVTKGRQGEVSATLKIGTISEMSQTVADERVRTAPGASFEQQGDTIRIDERPGNIASCSVDLVIPPDSDLEIEGPSVTIYVGSDGLGQWNPIPIKRLKVATGNFLHARIASPSTGSPSLDLTALRIDLAIDGRVVEPKPLPDDPQSGKRFEFKQ
jgi:hypothetical protein